jgi:hypothetical protein
LDIPNEDDGDSQFMRRPSLTGQKSKLTNSPVDSAPIPPKPIRKSLRALSEAGSVQVQSQDKENVSIEADSASAAASRQTRKRAIDSVRENFAIHTDHDSGDSLSQVLKRPVEGGNGDSAKRSSEEFSLRLRQAEGDSEDVPRNRSPKKMEKTIEDEPEEEAPKKSQKTATHELDEVPKKSQKTPEDELEEVPKKAHKTTDDDSEEVPQKAHKHIGEEPEGVPNRIQKTTEDESEDVPTKSQKTTDDGSEDVPKQGQKTTEDDLEDPPKKTQKTTEDDSDDSPKQPQRLSKADPGDSPLNGLTRPADDSTGNHRRQLKPAPDDEDDDNDSPLGKSQRGPSSPDKSWIKHAPGRRDGTDADPKSRLARRQVDPGPVPDQNERLPPNPDPLVKRISAKDQNWAPGFDGNRFQGQRPIPALPQPHFGFLFVVMIALVVGGVAFFTYGRMKTSKKTRELAQANEPLLEPDEFY